MKYLILLITLFCLPTYACSKRGPDTESEYPPVSERITNAEHVFIVKFTNVGAKPGNQRVIVGTVLESYKGSYMANTEYKFQIPGSGSCAPRIYPSTNEEWLVFIKGTAIEIIGINGYSSMPLHQVDNDTKSLLNTIRPFNQALKSQPSAAGTPQSGAP